MSARVILEIREGNSVTRLERTTNATAYWRDVEGDELGELLAEMTTAAMNALYPEAGAANANA